MKISLPATLFFVILGVSSAIAQNTVIVSMPNQTPAKAVLSAGEQKLMDKNILPKARKKLAGDSCNESVDIAGIVHGAFTRAGSDQTLVFYQFCQTGNGLGSVGLALFENGKAIGNYVSAESGWTDKAKALPDINQNGLDEIALFYSGGMHQGEGGIGVDIMEFSGGAPKGVGWFQAERFTENTDNAYKITVRPGRTPAFFRERWAANSAGKYRKAGNPLPMKLKPAYGIFEALK